MCWLIRSILSVGVLSLSVLYPLVFSISLLGILCSSSITADSHRLVFSIRSVFSISIGFSIAGFLYSCASHGGIIHALPTSLEGQSSLPLDTVEKIINQKKLTDAMNTTLK